MNEPTTDPIASSVRAELARRKVRQGVVASELGMTQQALSRRLNGITPFKAHELQLIASLVDVDVSLFYAAERRRADVSVPNLTA